MGRPRVDVTWRISGLFRDLFPVQIALIDAAVKLVAERDEDDEENPLAAASHGSAPARIFGNAPGVYGAGAEDLLGRDMDSAEVGAAYLAAASHCFGGAEGEGRALPGAFAERVRAADSPAAWQRRPGARLARRLRGCGLHRRLCRRCVLARQHRRADRSRCDRRQPAARADARCCARPHRAEPRRQSALHRGPDAPRRARRGRACRDRRPAGRFRRDHGGRSQARCSISCTTLISATSACATSSCARTRKQPRAIAERLDAARRQRAMASAA